MGEQCYFNDEVSDDTSPDCRLIFSFNYLPYHPDIFEKWPHVLVTGLIFFKI